MSIQMCHAILQAKVLVTFVFLMQFLIKLNMFEEYFTYLFVPLDYHTTLNVQQKIEKKKIGDL